MFERLKRAKDYKKPTDVRVEDCIERNMQLRHQECTECEVQGKCLRIQKRIGVKLW